MLCTEKTLERFSTDGKTITAEPLYCKRWSCEICAPRRKKRLISEVNRGEPQVLLTLTVNPNWFDSPEERAQELVKAFRILRKAVLRKYAYPSLPFMAVFEQTKRGEPHLHIALRVPWIDQKFIAHIMGRLIGAPVVDIRKIDNPGKAAAYLAKYLGKDPKVFQGCKRYWRSLDWLNTKTQQVWEDGKPQGHVQIIAERWDCYLAKRSNKTGIWQIDWIKKSAICELFRRPT